MAELRSGRAAAPEIRNRVKPLCALGMAAVALVAGVASAQASSGGGVAVGGSTGASETSAPGCPAAQLGDRTLKLGDCGLDVETLNWILKAKDYGQAPLDEQYEAPTADAVRDFQRDAELSATGVANTGTTAALVNAMPSQIATWYGPGFFGNETACGKVLTRRTMGVAHKTLPCGTKVVLNYKGRFVRTKVIDRGPFANHAKWDLTQATAQALGLDYTDDVRVAKLAR